MRRRKLAIVGTPNVGKSVLFNVLTGAYATVSNYPGTTVEVSRGLARIRGIPFEVIDTPGTYSLVPMTEEERVTLSLLLAEEVDVVVHVVDARNLRRMLPLTLQLIEADLRLVLDVNILDEAERIGIWIDIPGLERELGVPVVGTVLTRGFGVDVLMDRVAGCVQGISSVSGVSGIAGASGIPGASGISGIRGTPRLTCARLGAYRGPDSTRGARDRGRAPRALLHVPEGHRALAPFRREGCARSRA
ncbi:MAG: FeoB small GTPase domain-containing protein [Betaproteobacteria bacterium]